jgi:hypothetical protein
VEVAEAPVAGAVVDSVVVASAVAGDAVVMAGAWAQAVMRTKAAPKLRFMSPKILRTRTICH